MRILFVNENIGGHATVHWHLERALVSYPGVDADFMHVPRPGVARRAVGASIPGLGRLDLDLQPLRSQLALSWVVRKWLRHRIDDFDVVHIYTQNAALLSTEILESHPSVVSVDSTNTLNAYSLPHRKPTAWTPRTLPLVQRIERRVYDAATLVVASSEFAARSLRSTYSVAADRLRVLPMGVPIPDLPHRAEPPALPEVVFVGRQLERKGGRRLLQIHQQHLATRCTLVLVTGEPVAALPNVRVHDDIDVGDPRLTDILARGAVFAFPSEIDQSPNAVLEAMAIGLPVVAFRVGALTEMVEDGVTGSLVDPGDDRALLNAITVLLDDVELRERMGAAARRRARERYDANSNTGRLLEVLSEARNRFTPPRSD